MHIYMYTTNHVDTCCKACTYTHTCENGMQTPPHPSYDITNKHMHSCACMHAAIM